MKFINTTSRSEEPEIMDDFDLQGKELKKTLHDIDKVNNWLGGNKITINGIGELLQKTSIKGKIRIVDVGCGNGNMLRTVAEFGRKENQQFELVGIDGNAHAIEIAQKASKEYPEIRYKTLNAFSSGFKEMDVDIVLCTLTLHHFKDEEIIELLGLFLKSARLGVVINDLHRSSLAYYLFQLFCWAFIKNEIARKDGLISILRGFKKEDLERYSAHLQARSQKINWKWAFRYQWVIVK